VVCILPCSCCVLPWFLAKNINKTIAFLKYKIYQKARRKTVPKEQSNFIYSSTYKNSQINRMPIRQILFGLEKRAKYPRKKYQKAKAIPKT
jgi:hypothetical protein